MNEEEVTARITDALESRNKHLRNRNAVRALAAALGPQAQALAMIFDRKTAAEEERMRIQQDLILEGVCRLDALLSELSAQIGQAVTAEAQSPHRTVGIDAQDSSFQIGHVRIRNVDTGIKANRSKFAIEDFENEHDS